MNAALVNKSSHFNLHTLAHTYVHALCESVKVPLHSPVAVPPVMSTTTVNSTDTGPITSSVIVT